MPDDMEVSRPQEGRVATAPAVSARTAQMGLPDESSSKTCLPPTPVTMSLRKWASVLRSADGGEVGDFKEHRFQPWRRTTGRGTCEFEASF